MSSTPRRPLPPIAWHHHPRADHRPVLGDTPGERVARLVRLRAAIRAAGWTAAEANQRAHRRYHQPGVELLTAREADDLITALAPVPAPPVEDRQDHAA